MPLPLLAVGEASLSLGAGLEVLGFLLLFEPLLLDLDLSSESSSSSFESLSELVSRTGLGIWVGRFEVNVELGESSSFLFTNNWTLIWTVSIVGGEITHPGRVNGIFGHEPPSLLPSWADQKIDKRPPPLSLRTHTAGCCLVTHLERSTSGQREERKAGQKLRFGTRSVDTSALYKTGIRSGFNSIECFAIGKIDPYCLHNQGPVRNNPQRGAEMSGRQQNCHRYVF